MSESAVHPDRLQRVNACLREAIRVHTALVNEQAPQIVQAATMLAEALRAGHKVIWFGNGGSATQSQHMAAEFVGRFARERRALPSLSLTENMASVTAIANDYQYDQVFARQLEALANTGDVVVGLSTSGNSPNVLAGLRKARELGLTIIGLSGASGGAMGPLCTLCLCVPATDTARIQEAHLAIGHILCALTEETLCGDAPPVHH